MITDKNFIKENTYGISEQFNIENQLKCHIEEIYFKGFTIIEKLFDDEIIECAKNKLNDVEKIEKEELKKSHAFLNNDQDIIRCPLAYDHFFIELATEVTIHNLIKEILGPAYVLLMQNGVINKPNNLQYQTRWHRDLNYQHWVSSKCLALNFLILLDDFFVENGGTVVLPGSHLREEFPSENYIKKHEVSIVGKAGSVVVMDAMLFHRAGQNITKDSIRRGLNHVVGKPFFSQQIDMPNFIREIRNEDYSTDPLKAQFLGYKWNPSSNSVEWKKKRITS